MGDLDIQIIFVEVLLSLLPETGDFGGDEGLNAVREIDEPGDGEAEVPVEV